MGKAQLFRLIFMAGSSPKELEYHKDSRGLGVKGSSEFNELYGLMGTGS